MRGTWWHALHDGLGAPDRSRYLGRRLLSVFAARPGGRPVAAQVLRPDSRPAAAGARGPAALRQDRSPGGAALDAPPPGPRVRALTITLRDDHAPAAALGGELVAGGWRRGGQHLDFAGNDVGGGMRFGETTIDGGQGRPVRVRLLESPGRQRVASDADAPLRLYWRCADDDRDRRVQRRSAHCAALRHRLRRQRRLLRPRQHGARHLRQLADCISLKLFVRKGPPEAVSIIRRTS